MTGASPGPSINRGPTTIDGQRPARYSSDTPRGCHARCGRHEASRKNELYLGRPGAGKSGGGYMNHITIGEIVRGDREVFPPYLYEAYQSTRRRAPTLPLIDVPLTLSELTGPGTAISAITPEDADLTH